MRDGIGMVGVGCRSGKRNPEMEAAEKHKRKDDRYRLDGE